jgi:hypothetical protein
MTDLEIITTARHWIGTPFRHQGRKKGIGCDCLGLLVGVASELNLQDKNGNPLMLWDRQQYGHFPDSVVMQQILAASLILQESTMPHRGMIGLFCIDGRAQHLGIFGDYGEAEGLSLIHAYAPARKVIEHRLSEEWQQKIVAVYDVG